MAAAIRLLRAGREPSVAEIAEEAGIARRTVYSHFPTLEQLLTDARIGLLTKEMIDSAIDIVDPGGEVEARLEAMIDAVIETARTTLPLGRTLIKLTIEDPPPAGGLPRRGQRRIAWIEKALSPVKADLPPDVYARLVSVLAIVIGWEGLIVLSDLRALPEDQQRETTRWAARALLQAAREDARRARGRKGA